MSEEVKTIMAIEDAPSSGPTSSDPTSSDPPSSDPTSSDPFEEIVTDITKKSSKKDVDQLVTAINGLIDKLSKSTINLFTIDTSVSFLSIRGWAITWIAVGISGYKTLLLLPLNASIGYLAYFLLKQSYLHISSKI